MKTWRVSYYTLAGAYGVQIVQAYTAIDAGNIVRDTLRDCRSIISISEMPA